MRKVEFTHEAQCPICGDQNIECSHFLGWSDDGRVLSDVSEPGRVRGYEKGQTFPESAELRMTGVSCRVYLV